MNVVYIRFFIPPESLVRQFVGVRAWRGSEISTIFEIGPSLQFMLVDVLTI